MESKGFVCQNWLFICDVLQIYKLNTETMVCVNQLQLGMHMACLMDNVKTLFNRKNPPQAYSRHKQYMSRALLKAEIR